MQDSIDVAPILVFGATGAIGEATCREINKQKGKLLLSASSRSKNLQKLSKELLSPSLACDLVNNFDKNKLSDQLKKYTNKLGGIIISIARPFPHKLIHNTSEKVLIEQLNTQIVALDRIIKTCMPYLEEARKFCIPRIVYISTEYIIGSPPTKIGPYLAAKSAANTYAKVLAKELLGKGIRVFILAPGMVRSKLTANLPEEYLKQIESELPNRRLTTVSEISKTILAIMQGSLDGAYGNTIQISNAERR